MNPSKKSLWLFLCLMSVAMLCYTHFFLQNYLFMRPCEQCVYIRLSICIIVCGCLIALISPKNVFKVVAYSLCFWGVYLGFKHSFLLQKIHLAFKASNPFGISGCSHTPHFPFALPLDRLFPSFFRPNGACGLDAPLIPTEQISNLSALQRFFIGNVENNFTDGFYSKGWYMLPQFEFISMAEACLLAFGVFALGLGVSFCLWARKNFIYALCAITFTFALVCGETEYRTQITEHRIL